MKITKIETIQIPEHRDVLWVRVHTDEGLVGLGETYSHAEPAKTLIDQVYGPGHLLGADPLRIEMLWRAMFQSNYSGWAGAEMRAISAIDIALWDILGQVTGQPIYQLLGGACRDRIPIYNTCGAGPEYDFLRNPVELARDLLANGIRAMKIWPFDGLARQSGGHYLSRQDLQKGLEPVRRIREAVGDGIDIAMEFHGCWDLQCAVLIAQALEEFEVMWLEEILLPDNLEAYAHLAHATRLPLTVSERLLTRYQLLPVMQRGIARIIMFDVEWGGGISEGKKIATMAEAHQLPIAPHNYGGPVLNFASAHVAASSPNLMILETGRNQISQWTRDIITAPVGVANGHLALPEGPGLGTALQEDLLNRKDLIVGITA
jgi:L-alanine-DL-glutamate epimerase-like enolase superfamily enzyme